MSIPLADAKGKTYHNDDLTLTVNEVSIDPRTRQTTLDLSLKTQPGLDAGGINALGLIRGAANAAGPIEVVDAAGRVLSNWFLASQVVNGDVTRITIRLTPALGSEPPAGLRVFETSRTTTEAEFDFTDVDMP